MSRFWEERRKKNQRTKEYECNRRSVKNEQNEWFFVEKTLNIRNMLKIIHVHFS